jgi:hypothetical protein
MRLHGRFAPRNGSRRCATNEKTRRKNKRGKLNGFCSQTPRQLPIVVQAQGGLKLAKLGASGSSTLPNGVVFTLFDNTSANPISGTFNNQGTLKTGLTLTAISNTAATPISGTFANLPDGAILTVNGNNFQASYEGGDGNDLTLTVAP